MMDSYYTIFDGDKLFVEEPMFRGDDVVSYKRRLIMTKELFVQCYEKWILNKDKEEEDTQLG